MRTALAAAVLAALAGAGVFLYDRLRLSVAVAKPARGAAVEAVYATGVVEPVNFAKVAPVATGRIKDILAKDGDKVRRGAVLAKLDDREARGNVAALAAQRDFLRQERIRQEALYRKGFISGQALERVASELKQVEAQIAAAQKPLAETTLTSPMDGVVLRQDGEPGEMVSAGQVLFWVGQPQELRITADVDEEDIPRVVPGQTALIKADAFPDQVLKGTVKEITPKGDPVNKNYRVRIALPRETVLKTGMTTEVNIVVAERQGALLIPSTALSNGHVWVVRDGKAERVAVKTGTIGHKLTEVKDGLADDAMVVAAPPAGLKPGKHVRVIDSP
ncbi:MAG: efflux RND transporter periplasmic adaptor subunit [Betaproteobacteria bacterium]|nr:efflux RND transporter periplasmic adaptor subunit [Betaproteobacteria bacterium]